MGHKGFKPWQIKSVREDSHIAPVDFNYLVVIGTLIQFSHDRACCRAQVIHHTMGTTLIRLVVERMVDCIKLGVSIKIWQREGREEGEYCGTCLIQLLNHSQRDIRLNALQSPDIRSNGGSIL